MNNEPDITAAQWAAFMSLWLVLLVPVAVGLAGWLKRRYARAVVRLQAGTAGTQRPAVATAALDDASLHEQPAPALAVQVLAAAAVAAGGDDPTLPARRLRRRVLTVQFMAGAAYWMWLLVAATVGLAFYGAVTQPSSAQPASANPAGWAVLLSVVLVPPLLAWALQAGVREAVAWWIIVAGAVALGAGLAGTGNGLIAALAVPLVLAALGALLAAFLRPSVRGAGPPLIAAFSVAFLVFAAFSLIAVALDDGSGSGSDGWGTWQEVLLAVFLLLAALAVSAWVGWRMLLRISRRYVRKHFSELQLALGAYWGLMTLLVASGVMLLAFEERTGQVMPWVGAFIVLAWLAWRALQRLALRRAVRRAAPPLAPLLLLRVFKPSNRSEAFIDRFLARWRFAAPVWMIAGPDLAGALMEPDEFFAYLRRRLAERFVADAAELPQRMAALDGGRDSDGRFRVSELFCADTTWQAAVLAMIERAGVIVLDLREYTAARAGTRYELQELLLRAPLERVLFLTDEAGSAPQLCVTITEAWQGVGRRAGQTARVVQLERESDRELDGLFRVAARAAAAASAAPPA